jgi:molybdate-binding protein
MARELLDSNLQASGIAPTRLRGYDQILPGHLTAALAVANSQANCAVVTISAAKCSAWTSSRSRHRAST